MHGKFKRMANLTFDQFNVSLLNKHLNLLEMN